MAYIKTCDSFIAPFRKFDSMSTMTTSKIKNFFIDLKIPSGMRASIPLLVCEDAPVWICGYRIDERFKVTPATKRILKATVT